MAQPCCPAFQHGIIYEMQNQKVEGEKGTNGVTKGEARPVLNLSRKSEIKDMTTDHTTSGSLEA